MNDKIMEQIQGIRRKPCDAARLADQLELAVKALEGIHYPHFDGSFCRRQYEAGNKCCPACVAKMALAAIAEVK